MEFGKNERGKATLIYGEYLYSDMPCIEAWDEDGPYAVVTQVIPGIEIAKDEIILNHDIFVDPQFVNDFIEYLGVDKREVTFGPFDTKTYVVKLKENWKDLCVPY